MITEKQIATLKYLILQSRDSGTLAKKICFFLLDKSESLSRQVCLHISESGRYSERILQELSYGIHNMNSCNGSTHLGEIMNLVNTSFNFGFATGRHDSGKYYINVWLSWHTFGDTNTKQIAFDSQVIESIDLEPGLYAK